MNFNAHVCFTVRQLYNFHVKIVSNHDIRNLKIKPYGSSLFSYYTIISKTQLIGFHCLFSNLFISQHSN